MDNFDRHCRTLFATFGAVLGLVAWTATQWAVAAGPSTFWAFVLPAFFYTGIHLGLKFSD
jgi:hypothetical protein